MSVIICAINCSQIIHHLFVIFHSIYYPLFIFIIIFIIIHIFAVKVVHINLWHCFDMVKCGFISFMLFLSSNNLSCVVSFLWGSHWFVILHLECSTQNFWGVCVTWWSYGDLMVILGSPRITYYTGYTFDFNVNYSYLYLFKIKYIVL